MKYVVKQIDGSSIDKIYYGVSIDKIYYGVYFGQDLILLLNEKDRAYKICEKWNTKKITINK